MRVGGKNPKSVRWNDKIKAAVKRKEAAWKGVWKMYESIQRRKG